MVWIVPELLVTLPPPANVRLLVLVVLRVKEVAPELKVRKPTVVDAVILGEWRLAAAVPKNTAVVPALVGVPPLQFVAVLQVLLLLPDHTKSAAKAGTDERIPANRTGTNNEHKRERHGLFIGNLLPHRIAISMKATTLRSQGPQSIRRSLQILTLFVHFESLIT